MYRGLKVGAVVPARDEERNIGPVVRDLLALRDAAGSRVIDDFVVCDNGSADETALRAQEAGARVVHQDRPGYGIACLTALAALAPVDVVLFTDGDGSFVAAEAERLLAEVAGGRGPRHRLPGARLRRAGSALPAAGGGEPGGRAPDPPALGAADQ